MNCSNKTKIIIIKRKSKHNKCDECNDDEEEKKRNGNGPDFHLFLVGFKIDIFC